MLQVVKTEMKAVAKDLYFQGKMIGSITALLWLIELVNFAIFNHGLSIYGIHPRNTQYLLGILLAPLLHGSFAHLTANTPPFIALGWLVLARDRTEFFIISLVVTITSGLGAWLFGASNSVHVGASGVIFGYFGFLLARGFFDRKLVSMLLSLIVGAIYGYLIFGVLPVQMGVSWQGHLFGFIGGVLTAWALSRR
jgi:membrane associated rhomboid family serine protease